METTMRFMEATHDNCSVRSEGFMERLARFIKALFETAEQNPLGLDNGMLARMYL